MMIARRSTLAAALVSLLALAACGQPKEPAAVASTKPAVINFAIAATENRQSQMKDLAPFMADMEKAVGIPVKPFFGSNYTALIEGMRFKQVDFGWFTNQSGLEAVRRANGVVFARTVKPNGADGYQAVIIVKKGSGITLEKLLACDKSIDFGMGDAKSTSGTLAPMTYLFAPKKITPETCFKTVRNANHEANLFGVASGMLGAATNNTASMERLGMTGNPQGKQTLENVQVIWTSPTIPEDPLVRRKDFDPETWAKVEKFMFSYGVGDGPEAERQRKILAQIQTAPFKRADDSHLLPVREMEASGQLIQAQTKGDAAGVTAAQAALAEIAKERAAAPK